MAANTPKAMSSRLATMKFMQRSAAKSGASLSTPNGPPSKRARLSNGTSAPGTPGTPDNYEILQSALAVEEKKRQDALDKAAQHKGETKWVLSFKETIDDKHDKSMRVRQAGFAEIDADDEEEDEEEDPRPIRMQFGGGIKKKQGSNLPENTERSEGETDSEDYDSDDPTAALIRETKREVAAERRESHKEGGASTGYKSMKEPPRPLDEDEDLTGLSSLSGGRRLPTRDMSNVECFNCGRTGHLRDRCPKPKVGRGRGRGSARR